MGIVRRKLSVESGSVTYNRCCFSCALIVQINLKQLKLRPNLSNILNKIALSVQNLKEEDLDNWIVPELLDFYKEKISYLTYKSYGSSSNPVSNAAFKEQARSVLRISCHSFLFKMEHWRTGRDLNPYLLSSLKRLSGKLFCDAESVKKINVPICPGCKSLGNKEYLHQENNLLRCKFCTAEFERLTLDLKYKGNIDFKTTILFESRIKMHKSFALHSMSGFRCPECEGFLPKSLEGKFGISCPFPDCSFSGKADNLEKKIHPVGFSQRNDKSMQESVTKFDNGNEVEFQSLFSDDKNINPDIMIEMHENYEIELSTLKQVLEEQIQQVKRTNSSGTMLQKLSMYEAYQNMLEKYPEDMISYLVHRKQNTEYPIQSRIFQEYVKIIEDSLPYDIKIAGNEKYTVCSLTDPNLQLFLGKSEFDAVVDSNGIIPNNTKETYVGSTTFKDYGNCFIGQLIKIVNKRTGLSLKDNVKNYTFVQINMENVEPGTEVTVSHFRINSHYELGALVYLQRIRRRIVDSIYFRLNGKYRN